MADNLEIKLTGSKGTPIILEENGPLNVNIQSSQRENNEIKKDSLLLQILSTVAGARAESLYDIAVRNGYTGTEAEFIEYMRTQVVQTTGQSETSVMSQKAVTLELDVLKAAVFPLTVTFSHSGDSVLEYTGTAKNVTLTWSVSRNGSSLTPTSISINGQSYTPAAAGSATVSVNSLGTNTFTITVVADGLTATASTSVSMVLPMYMGFYNAGSNVNTMSQSLNKLVKLSPNGSYTYTNTGSPKYLTICVPSSMSVNSVKSSGFDVPMQSPVTDNSMTIGGATRTYKIYRSASQINVGQMSFVIS